MADIEQQGESEVATPITMVMQTPYFNLTVIAVMGFSSPVEFNTVKYEVSGKLIKHPRFASLLVMEDEKKFKMSWIPTKVNIDEHVFEHVFDPEIEPKQGDIYLEEFTKTLAEKPLDPTKPLWEVHLLNMRTTNSNSTVFFKIHHSLGDGISLISIVLACARKCSDPEALPVLPSSHKRRSNQCKRGFLVAFFSLIWTMILMMYYTFIDSLAMLGTILFFGDSDNPLKGGEGMENSPKRYVHRILNMDDVRLIKNSMDTTVNDVLFGVVDASLTRYIQRRYEKDNANEDKETVKKMLQKLRVRAAVAFNMRPSATIQDAYGVIHENKTLDVKTWGNMVSFVLFPMKLKVHEDPLCYLRDAKALLNRKKLSAQSIIGFYALRMMIHLCGLMYGGKIIRRLHRQVSFDISSVMGPREDIFLFNTPITYLAPTVSGVPVSTVIHFQSFGNKLILSLALDEKLIPDPHQLCDDFQYSLQLIKDTVVKKIGVDENRAS